MVRVKISGKRNFFQVREKSGNFVDCQGNLESTWKVREKSGNLKINGYGRKSSESTFSRDSLSPSATSLGATLKGKNLLPWEANHFL